MRRTALLFTATVAFCVLGVTAFAATSNDEEPTQIQPPYQQAVPECDTTILQFEPIVDDEVVAEAQTRLVWLVRTRDSLLEESDSDQALSVHQQFDHHIARQECLIETFGSKEAGA